MGIYAIINKEDYKVTNRVVSDNLDDIVIFLNENEFVIEDTDETGISSIGCLYFTEKNKFQPPKPFDCWIWSEKLFSWQPPIPQPEDGKTYFWDCEKSEWVEAATIS